MDYVYSPITAARVSVEALINRGITRYLRRHNMSITLCVLAMIIGFNTAVAIQLLSAVLVLPLDSILCGSLLSVTFLSRSKKTLCIANTSNSCEINVDDLLERKVVPMETIEAKAFLKGKVILVTGGAGSIGSELCRQLLNYEPELLIALDTNETGLFDLVEGLRSRSHPRTASLSPFIGDITDVQRMERFFAERQPDVVFHAAAYKHVSLLEQYPDLAIRTNAHATYHLCSLAQQYGTGCFVFVSTDKAADPVSIMGASKRFAELIVQSQAKSSQGTRFCTVRFGNVIGSRGSVVPIFAQQIEQGGPLTVTDPQATRYFMTIPEACGLVILSSAIAEQGGLYLLDMGDPVRIMDLAVKMIRQYGLREEQDISIVYTGLRPGERLHETLVAIDEELLPTSNSKILRISHKGRVPSSKTVDQWITALEESLQEFDCIKLRKHLFQIIEGISYPRLR